MQDKALIIQQACHLLLHDKQERAVEYLRREYAFEYKKVHTRSYTSAQKMRVFVRDGFIDRYSGDKLVIPGILKVLSYYFPQDFPYHPNWKMDETHMAYWEIAPTIDHVVPIALGGEDVESNWVTTSMLHNAIKSNWTLEQLGWKLVERGNPAEWDGLVRLFVDIVDADKGLLTDTYISGWYRLAKAI